MWQAVFVFGVFVNVYGVILYIRGTLRGENKPNRITFFLWSLATFISAIAALIQGAAWGSAPAFASAALCFVIFAASFFNPRAHWRLGPFDWGCGALSVLAMILWQTTRQPDLAILFGILADATAAIPTLVKCWRAPETENSWGYLGGLLMSPPALAMADRWTFAEVAFPLYLTLICLTIVGLIEYGKWRITRKKTKAGKL